MKIKISPSIMCVDTYRYEYYIKSFEESDIDYIHFDVMDGKFVPNIMLGMNVYNDIKQKTNIPIDIHLMVENPEQVINYFDVVEDDIITVHIESTNNIFGLLKLIKDKGCKCGISLNPGTPIHMIEEIINEVDFVLVMTIIPGFAGQKIIPSMFDKVRRIKELIERKNSSAKIIVDGNTTIENSKVLLKNGAEIIVVGTSSILNPKLNFSVAYKEYVSALSEEENSAYGNLEMQ
jgi:ribulose-phosphate 3-epimerase